MRFSRFDIQTVSAIFLACALGTQGLLECVHRDERFDMTWSLTTYKQRAEDRTGVRLEFADHPGWTTDIESKDLADYLVARGSPRVPVTFRVVRDFGILRRFRVMQVADLQDWGFNGCTGPSLCFGWMRSLTSIPESTCQAPIR